MKADTNDSEAPAHGQQVVVVCGIINRVRDGRMEVLLPQRASTKRFMPMVFELPGGHVDFGEALTEALKREVLEELDLEIKVGRLVDAFDYLNEVKGSHSVELIYEAHLLREDDEPKLNPGDHVTYKWLSVDTLSEMLVGGKTSADEEYQVVLDFLTQRVVDSI
ncbi:MAG: NUDIX hydrolase [Acidobacteriota bacterium]|nr:NUDIX hydrolase [Acidobacteriota bacterium]